MANALLGFDNLASIIDRKLRKRLPFKIGHGLRSKTKKTTFSTGGFKGNGPNITVVDTPGFKVGPTTIIMFHKLVNNMIPIIIPTFFSAFLNLASVWQIRTLEPLNTQ